MATKKKTAEVARKLTAARASAIKYLQSFVYEDADFDERRKRAIKMLKAGTFNSPGLGPVAIKTRSDAMTWSRRSMQKDGRWPGYDVNYRRVAR